MKGSLLEKFKRLVPVGKPIDEKARDLAFEALRQAEEKYHSIFDNAVEGIFQTTPEGQYVSANPALARIYGYESPLELIASVRDICNQIYVDPNRRGEFIELMQRDGVVRQFESEIRRKSGERRWILENVRAVRGLSGDVDYYEGTVQDITEKKRAQEALERSQEALAAELAEAAQYVRSLLPPEQVEPFGIHWRYLPSSQLGGDSFGYQWLDPDHLALYLLDVSGHGVGAALLSITVMNVLRARSLPGADFFNPASVLQALHTAFPFSQQNGKFFTIWYGVYDRRTRQIIYTTGGHHGAVLLAPGEEPQILKTGGPIVGIVDHPKFATETITLPMRGRLYVFSDGMFEITRPDGSIMTFEQFVSLLEHFTENPKSSLGAILLELREIRNGREFEDDLSIIELAFY